MMTALKKYTEDELKEILRLHALWLVNEPDGKLANLSYSDLSYSDLSYSNLSYSNLSYSNLSYSYLSYSDLSYSDLSYSNLSYSNLSYSNLSYSYLSYSDLSYSDLRGSNLRGSNLSYSYLSYSDLSYSDLSCSDLSYSDLRGSNLRGSNLSYSYLRGSDLSYSDLRGSNLSYSNLSGSDLKNCIGLGEQPIGTTIVPEDGSFVGFKKARHEKEFYVLTLQILSGAKRVSVIGSRKCRAEAVRVLSAETLDGELTDIINFNSIHDQNFIYTVGEEVRVADFDPSCTIECSSGIHFYLTRAEARNH